MQDAKCKMQDARCKMQDARCKMQDARCKMLWEIKADKVMINYLEEKETECILNNITEIGKMLFSLISKIH